MKRLTLFGSWKRIGIQAGVLAGLGLAFIGTPEQPATAANDCPMEGECTFKKPNFMIIMDYSSSMNQNFDPNVTRWEAAVNAVQELMTTDQSFFSKNMNIALMRFGHDPDPDSPGTTIPNDTSGIVDGQALDVHWYDPQAQDKSYISCNGQAIIDSLNSTPAPLCQGQNCSGIGTWTKGALDFASQLIDQSRADHPDDIDPNDPSKNRLYALLLMTDGLWTNPTGVQQLNPPSENPAITAADLYNNKDVPTYVVALGDAQGQMFTDEIAMAGGTMQAIDAGNPQQLIDSLKQVVEDIKNNVIIPTCTSGLPRIMIVLDASSSMLNVGNQAGPMGQTGWDQARDALSGANSIFDVEVGTVMQPVEDLVHLGLIAFGHNQPKQGQVPDNVGEETVLVDYGPCMKDNFDWALDPNTSCEAPGCTDPWSGPPITWTFKTSPPDLNQFGNTFDQLTRSHMPSCDEQPGDLRCLGSGTYTHLGLQLANSNRQSYIANPPALYPIDANTVFVNILITDGDYSGYSTDSQVAAELTSAYNEGVTTYVIGFGDAPSQTLLDRMACWGSGGTGVPNCAGGSTPAFDAGTQQQLEDALKTIIEGLSFDPCCAFNDCSANPEPTTGEPDPVGTTTSGGASGTAGTAGTAGGTAGTGPATTSGGGTTTGGASSGGATTTATSGTGTGGDTSAGPASATATATATATDGTATDGSTGGTDTAGASSDDDGCGCRADDTPRGLGATLLTLALAGLGRRRRRA